MLTFGGSSAGRKFTVIRPSDEKPDEVLPVVFVWHWLNVVGDTARNAFQLDAATSKYRFIGVVPESKNDSPWNWPYDALATDARLDEEAQFFDDMLSCVTTQITNAALHCVSTIAFSAGALFASQLATRRSERLSSVVSLSGGIGGAIRDFVPSPVHRLPFIVLWGGPTDRLDPLVDFEAASKHLLDQLSGFAVVECIHDCGHNVPPFETPLRMDPAYRFAMDHPYGLPAGESPYSSGLPKEFPDWCSFGIGHTVARTKGPPCPSL
jgi:predicted esterase